MDIKLYTVIDPAEKIGKTRNTEIALTGNLRDGCSLLDPVVNIAAASITSNYAYIPQFSRYYFIRKITCVRTGMFQLEMHVDVLDSYATPIKANTAIIKRQQNVYNLYLDDPMFQTQNRQQIVTKVFPSTAFYPSGLTGTTCFVLTVVGGG